MLKEVKGLEYALEILRVLNKHGGEHDSKAVCGLIKSENRVEVSQSYVQKVLPRMVKSGLINSSGTGYTLSKKVTEITVDMILDLCDMPSNAEPLYDLCRKLKNSVAMTSVTEVYNFN